VSAVSAVSAAFGLGKQRGWYLLLLVTRNSCACVGVWGGEDNTDTRPARVMYNKAPPPPEEVVEPVLPAGKQ
jgi:hypothetical protein